MAVRCKSEETGKRLQNLNANRRGKLQTARPFPAELSGLNQWKGISWTPLAPQSPGLVRAARQLSKPSSLTLAAAGPDARVGLLVAAHGNRIDSPFDRLE